MKKWRGTNFTSSLKLDIRTIIKCIWSIFKEANVPSCRTWGTNKSGNLGKRTKRNGRWDLLETLAKPRDKNQLQFSMVKNFLNLVQDNWKKPSILQRTSQLWTRWLSLMQPVSAILNSSPLSESIASSACSLSAQNFYKFTENVEIMTCLELYFDCGQTLEYMIGHLGN